jgi:hypothetical protein
MTSWDVKVGDTYLIACGYGEDSSACPYSPYGFVPITLGAAFVLDVDQIVSTHSRIDPRFRYNAAFSTLEIRLFESDRSTAVALSEAVPEPSVMALAGPAVAAMIIFRRRRKP